MTYSCSDFTDDVLHQLVQSGVLKEDKIPDDDPEIQALLACDAIYALSTQRYALRAALTQCASFIENVTDEDPATWPAVAAGVPQPGQGEPQPKGLDRHGQNRGKNLAIFSRSRRFPHQLDVIATRRLRPVARR